MLDLICNNGRTHPVVAYLLQSCPCYWKFAGSNPSTTRKWGRLSKAPHTLLPRCPLLGGSPLLHSVNGWNAENKNSCCSDGVLWCGVFTHDYNWLLFFTFLNIKIILSTCFCHRQELFNQDIYIYSFAWFFECSVFFNMLSKVQIPNGQKGQLHIIIHILVRDPYTFGLSWHTG